MERFHSAAGAVKVPKKSDKTGQASGPPPARKQYNIGFGTDFATRIDAAAETLGLDPVNFLRMVIRENFARYEKRAEAIRGGESPD
jgi:hypothetical protein